MSLDLGYLSLPAHLSTPASRPKVLRNYLHLLVPDRVSSLELDILVPRDKARILQLSRIDLPS
jgi:hypothetical protein